MKSLFDNETYNEIKTRLDSLSENQIPLWGKMSVSQMLCHCQGPLKVPLQQIELSIPNPVMKSILTLFKSSLYNDRPWPKGMKTSKEFKIEENKDFGTERIKLNEVMEEFYSKRFSKEFPPHPIFGQFSMLQWGQMQYKHLDHHLRQFGV